MFNVIGIPAFDDNYIWAITENGNAVVVDPGDANAVQAWLAESGCKLKAILLTHHHGDHIGGVRTLLADATIPVIGHAEDAHRLPPLSKPVRDGDCIALPGLSLQISVLATPGHTVGHICYFGHGLLFCGDTLFSAGCGRMFEGTAEQFESSLARLAALPAATKVYAAHEYTQGNITFAAMLTPDDPGLKAAVIDVRARRAAGLSTLPSTIGWELRHNPFLRCAERDIAAASGLPDAVPSAVFAALRRAKDVFRA